MPGSSEIASVLAAIKGHGVRNVVWLTGDVHDTAAHSYDPARGTFSDFDPFWEFVAGPINAGTFGPTVIRPTPSSGRDPSHLSRRFPPRSLESTDR